jgi:hypothetical protein
MRLFNSDLLHAHTSDACVQAFVAALSSWRVRRKTDPYAKPPRRRKWYFRIEYKSSAITLKDSLLFLSNGRTNAPLVLFWEWERPKTVVVHWTGTEYEAIATYRVGEGVPEQEVRSPEERRAEHTAGIDLVLQSQLARSSRGSERCLRRHQDLQDACPDPLFAPAQITARHGRPWSETLGQFAPGRASPSDPQHAFHDQAMISRSAACVRLLWRQEERQLFPVGISEGGQPRQRDGSREMIGYRRGLTRAPQDMILSGGRLMLTPEAGPVQSPDLLLLRFAQRVQEATHLWHT